ALSKANLLNQPELKNFTYIAPLKEQIKNFQKSQGLNPDGIAGEHTLILLNTALGLDVPLLNSQS
ncbi:MAG TPA: peptidoglycan-binding protein, partial [Pseudomonadales bacterium]